jgi:hypothetical protein
VHAAAHVLAKHDQQDRAAVHQAFVKVLRSIGVTKRHCGPLEDALTHFLKVTRSYRSGLFHCYDDSAIPRTNNDLEQCFGQHRFHERRATGRKRGAPSAVLRGSVRLVASVATRLAGLQQWISSRTTARSGGRSARRCEAGSHSGHKGGGSAEIQRRISNSWRPTTSS